MSIKVSGLSKFYGTQKAVNNISFSLAKGEIVGFLGPNGAGKSTTMKMITGYLQPAEGSIDVCGLPVNENNIAAKKKIGYLPEANPLYPDMFVREYLSFLAGVHHVDNAKGRIEEVIILVGLQKEAYKKCGQLSKGYKQRVGLAAALLHNPEVLILDEPTSGLDPNQITEIRSVIKSLATEKTILFSSHILQEVEAICDRVIIISKGEIVADKTLAALRNNYSSTPMVRVSFKEQTNIDALRSIPGVLHAEEASNNVFLLQAADADALKKALLHFSIEHNLDVLSLQTEQQSLEDVFKSLTVAEMKN